VDLSFLRSRRWLVRHVIVMVVVAGCAGLGKWQLDRLHRQHVRDRLVAARVRLPPAPLAQAISRGGAYRRADAVGRFDSAHELILRARSLDGRPGNHILTPLVLGAGDALLVDRGWVPLDLDRPPVAPAVPPEGSVRVTGVLVPPDATTQGRSRERLESVGRVDLGRLQEQMPYRLAPLYLLMRMQKPAQPGALPIPAAFDPTIPGPPHLSYAIQWFSFAALALVTYGALIRKTAREPSEATNESSGPTD
jgi:cytochrome oxidase assembly protein ShyY1